MSSNSKILIIGAGGAGTDALCVAQRMLAAGTATFAGVHGFADDNPALAGTAFDGIPVLGTVAQVVAAFGGGDRLFHCAVGGNQPRQKLALLLEAQGWQAVSLIDPSAIVAASARIGAGTFVGALSFVAPQACVGRHVIVNINASIGHHSQCGDFVQICPGARISGYASLGEGVLVGSNGVVAPGVTVGEWATVGAASLAVRDVAARTLAVGVPARRLPLAAPGD
jgi:sugar O-acyltransferase (sialic acid O-acetyltransferase NeuD family)